LKDFGFGMEINLSRPSLCCARYYAVNDNKIDDCIKLAIKIAQYIGILLIFFMVFICRIISIGIYLS